MVKNSGGNKSKKQARKSVALPQATQNVRYVAETGEMYAVITNIYGGKTCQVMCDDGVSRRCTIRRKFMMARRGDNAIAAGTWIMAGLYDWEKRADGTQTCDMLEVYSAGERDKLKQTVNANILKHVIEANNAFDGNKNGNEFLFSETLADIAAEKDEGEENVYSTESDADEADEEDEACVVKKQSVIKKQSVKEQSVKEQSVKEQTDWMNINVDDI